MSEDAPADTGDASRRPGSSWPDAGHRAGRKRAALAVGAAVAAAVSVVFATVGDGVPTRGEGIVRVVIAHGHTVTWALLAGSLAAAAVGRGPRALASTLGYGALGCYGVFLAATFATG